MKGTLERTHLAYTTIKEQLNHLANHSNRHLGFAILVRSD